MKNMSKKNYLKAISFKNENKEFFKNAKYKTLKTNNEKVFAYSMTYENKKLIAVGSLDENGTQNIVLEENALNKRYSFSLINVKNSPKIVKDKIKIKLEPLEMQVYMIKNQ